MRDYTENYERAQRNLAVARAMLTNQYLDRIRREYGCGTPEVKNLIFGLLEKIVDNFGEPSVCVLFNPELARKLRIAADLTQVQLGKLISIDPTYITHFEKGRRNPVPVNPVDNVTPNEKALGYLNWLKEQGYNPYNL
jgi:uncharacterized protein (UPF0297 family)